MFHYIPGSFEYGVSAGVTFAQTVTLFRGPAGGVWVSGAGVSDIDNVRFAVPAGRRLVLDAVTAVPEPMSIALLLRGIGALACHRR
jgi:hypothetical protein